MDPVILNEQKGWGLEGNENFFMTHRSQVEHLYRSEKFFLPAVIPQVKNCLDIGCACGDFSHILSYYNPDIQYTGVDIIPRFVKIAQERYPQCRFIVSDGAHLDFPDASFDLVFSSGILHLNSRYQDIVRDMYRVSSRYVLCDFRLTETDDVVGKMDVNLMQQDEKAPALPYYVLNMDNHLEFLRALDPRPLSITVKGYAHAPTKSANIGLDKIYMAFFLIDKGSVSNQETQVHIDLNA